MQIERLISFPKKPSKRVFSFKTSFFSCEKTGFDRKNSFWKDFFGKKLGVLFASNLA